MPSDSVRDGEVLFRAYINQRPDLSAEFEASSGSRKPDFTVDGPDGPAICEIYSPELILRNRSGSFDAFKPVNGAFKSRKRAQGAKAKNEGVPYVVVVSSANSDVALAEFELFVGAFGRKRPLRNGQNTRFSAIAAIRRFNPTLHRLQRETRQRLPPKPSLEQAWSVVTDVEGELTKAGDFDPSAAVARLQVIHNPWAANPLPEGYFGGPHDEQFRLRLDTEPTTMERFWTGWRIHEVPDDDQYG
ncbi:MAG: hypothetical protein ACE37B_11775 [Ilumatobacter sp.]|uniref:hypothetical protein n=1 Tax=Ilumatobacter sp. TaxID=1967498 RepID=UPI00391A0D5C